MPDIQAQYGRDPIAQAMENARQLMRCLELAAGPDAGALCPHPLVVASAELENVRRYIEAAKAQG